LNTRLSTAFHGGGTSIDYSICLL